MLLGAERGVERRGEGGRGRGGADSWMLADVGRPAVFFPTQGVSKQRACFETVSKRPHQETTSNNSAIDNGISHT